MTAPDTALAAVTSNAVGLLRRECRAKSRRDGDLFLMPMT
jgi:hypothetical protein